MKAFLKQTRISPKKANLIAGIIRSMPAVKALDTLKYMPKKGAQIIYKILASAVANAENNFAQSKKDLMVSAVLVSPGPIYKRGQSHSKGRVTSLFKRTSHITVELAALEIEAKKEEKKEAPAKSEAKVEKKETAKKTTVKSSKK